VYSTFHSAAQALDRPAWVERGAGPADTAHVEVAGIVAAAVLVPVVVGAVAGVVVRPGDSHRQTLAVAGLAALAIVFMLILVGFAITPDKQCVRETCDNGYAVGALFAYPPTFGLSFMGAWLGRLGARRRHQRHDAPRR
jgi:hypothetical protein